MFGRLLLTAILATAPAFAQRGAGGDESGSMGTSIPRAQPVTKAAMFADRLKLDKTQQGNARSLFQMMKGIFSEKNWNAVQ